MSTLWNIVVSAGLVAINAVFVAAEFAIVGVSKAAIERLSIKGDPRARQVLRVLEDSKTRDRFIATSQIGITVASLALGMFGEHALAAGISNLFARIGFESGTVAHFFASALAIGILGFFHIVLGEMVPKTLALANIDRAALLLTPMVLGLRMILYPFVGTLNVIGQLTLRMFGIKKQTEDHERTYTADELRYVLRESQEGGKLRTEAGKLMLRLFEFGNLTAGEVMVPRVRVTGIPVGAPSIDVAGVLRHTVHTRYPVYDGDLDHIVGMIHVKEALRRVIKGKPILRQHTRAAPFVPLTATLDVVMETMGRSRAQMVVVMDEQGGTAGILTIEDIFEEVIGEIDERPTDQPDVWKDDLGRIRASGTARLSELNEVLATPIAEDGVTTVGGLVLHVLGRPAKDGDVVTFGRYTIEVRSTMGRGVRECIVKDKMSSSAPITKK